VLKVCPIMDKAQSSMAQVGAPTRMAMSRD